MVNGGGERAAVSSGACSFSLTGTPRAVVGIVNINNNNNGTIDGVCHRNVQSMSFMLYGASGRTLRGSRIPGGLLVKRGAARKLNSKGIPRIKRGTTLRDRRSVCQVLSSNAHVTFIATKVKNNAKAKTKPMITGVSGSVKVLAINVIAVPFIFRKQPGVIGTLHNIEGVTRGISSLLIVGGRQLEGFTSVPIPRTGHGTSRALAVTTGDVTRVIAASLRRGISFTSISAAVHGDKITLVDVNFKRKRKHLQRTVARTLRDALIGSIGGVFGTGQMTFIVCCDRRSRLHVDRVSSVRSFVSRFGARCRIG